MNRAKNIQDVKVDVATYIHFIAILDNGIDCRFCGKRLSSKNVDMYDHDKGIFTPFSDQKQWVYVTCENKRCQYQWSFVKIIRRADV